MRIETLNGFIETKTDLTEWEQIEVSKMVSKGVCTNCLANWLMKRDLIITKQEAKFEKAQMHIIDILPN